MHRSVEDDPRSSPAAPARSAAERAEAWALTGPPGRVLSFAIEVVAALPVLARYWWGRLRSRSGHS